MYYGNCNVLPGEAVTYCGEVDAFHLPPAGTSLSLAQQLGLSPLPFTGDASQYSKI